ncbi:hypothetical protein ACFODZ_03270 [Marinicella sediminis]|uniref:Periplasmic heavy metal sensor n=1 Tax=Marinicella sediminis TaxID=1792834 RepID=A0ABV7JCX0_9GAMM|nr:hypothetical protein [Marinicella sediminis]
MKPFTFRQCSLSIVVLAVMATVPVSFSHAGTGHFHAETESTKALMSKMWWNQKRKIDELSITEDQRHKMDHDFVAYMQYHQDDHKNQKDAFDALGKVLSGVDLSKAGTQRDQVSQMAVININRQVDMMINVVGHLNEQQRAMIAEKYPKLLTRLWVRSANPAAMQLGRSEVKRSKSRK